jgi:excisionase family DNA binding protein
MASSCNKVLLTVEEVADRLSLGRSKVYELIASGAIQSVTIGRSRRVAATAVEAFVLALRARDDEEREP